MSLDRVKRPDFIVIVAGAVVLAWPIAAGAASCDNESIDRAVREVTGRDPLPAECNAKRWGRWKSYGDLRQRVYQDVRLKARARVATQKLMRNPWDRATLPTELATSTSGVSNEKLPYFYW
jgi:hypothetical protein